MITETKILIELDVPTISGYIYPKELSMDIMKTIEEQQIGGEIYVGKNIPNPETIKPRFYISNPIIAVDETIEEPELIIYCDVNIDETKLTSTEINLLQTKPWRLSMVGLGEATDGIINKYELKYVNIEIVDDIYYNQQNNREG